MADMYIFGKITLKMFSKEIDLINDTLRCMLLKDTATINQHTDEYISDINGDEVTGSGYSAGGATLSNVSSSYSAPTMTFDADDVVWPSSTITAKYAVIYDDTGLETTSPVMCYLDFGANQTTAGQDFEINFSSNGIFTTII